MSNSYEVEQILEFASLLTTFHFQSHPSAQMCTQDCQADRVDSEIVPELLKVAVAERICYSSVTLLQRMCMCCPVKALLRSVVLFKPVGGCRVYCFKCRVSKSDTGVKEKDS